CRPDVISAGSKPGISSCPTCLVMSDFRDGIRLAICAPTKQLLAPGYQHRGLRVPFVLLRVNGSCRFLQRAFSRSYTKGTRRFTKEIWAASVYLPLQLGEQVERLERCQPVQINLAQAFEDRLRDRREDRQLRRTSFCAGRQLPGHALLGSFVLGQHFP